MNPITEIHKIAHHIPTKALMDIDNRIRDWLASGGKEDDPYVWSSWLMLKDLLRSEED